MKELPEHLKGKEFPRRENTKKGVTSQVYDVTTQVLKNLEALHSTTWWPSAATTRSATPPGWTKRASRWSASPRPWTTMCATPSTASASPPPSRAPRMPSSASAPRSARTSASASSASSGAMPAHTALYTAYVASIRCCIPEYKVDLEKLIDLVIADKRNNPSNYSLVVLSEGAEWEGYKVREYGEPDAYGHRKKMSVAEDLSDEIKQRTRRGDRGQRPDLRPARRQPGLRRQAGGHHLRQHGAGCHHRPASTGS